MTRVSEAKKQEPRGSIEPHLTRSPCLVASFRSSIRLLAYGSREEDVERRTTDVRKVGRLEQNDSRMRQLSLYSPLGADRLVRIVGSLIPAFGDESIICNL